MKNLRTVYKIATQIVGITFPLHAADIDFEQVQGRIPFEGLSISNQFAPAFGLRLTSLDNRYFPIVVQQGRPGRIFESATGFDSVLATDTNRIGQFFLGDPASNVEEGAKGFMVHFDEPVSRFSLYLIDLDGTERVTLTAYTSEIAGSSIATNVYSAADSPPFGDSVSAFVVIQDTARRIRRVRVAATGGVKGANVGFDRLSSDFIPSPTTQPQVHFRWAPGLLISGTEGFPYRIEYSDELDRNPTSTNWHVLETNYYLVRSPDWFFDTSPTNSTSRFYRVVPIH